MEEEEISNSGRFESKSHLFKMSIFKLMDFIYLVFWIKLWNNWNFSADYTL